MQSHIDSLGRRIGMLVQALIANGFKFDKPEWVFPGPEPHALEAIHRIEAVVGTLPLALKLFWLTVGSVDLTGYHPEWDACEYLDQLIIFPPSAAIGELEDFLSSREERPRSGFQYEVPVAPDIFHKANVSGGAPYSISVPADSDDPILENASPKLSLLSHLERALEYAGFPGLAQIPGHNWPIAELTSTQ